MKNYTIKYPFNYQEDNCVFLRSSKCAEIMTSTKVKNLKLKIINGNKIKI